MRLVWFPIGLALATSVVHAQPVVQSAPADAGPTAPLAELYFFNIDDDALVDGKRPERTVFVPTVGVIGRL